VDQLVTDTLHHAFLAIAHQAVLLLLRQCRSRASLTEKLTDAISLYGEVGLEVVAALVHMDVAPTAEQDFEALLHLPRDYLGVWDETDPALPLQYLLEGGTPFQLVLSTHLIIIHEGVYICFHAHR
jgi:hypothetical protein